MPGKAFRQEQNESNKNFIINSSELINNQKNNQVLNNNVTNDKSILVQTIKATITTVAAPAESNKVSYNTNRYSPRENNIELVKCEKFKTILASNPINLEELQKASWKGISRAYRPICWKLLSVIIFIYNSNFF